MEWNDTLPKRFAKSPADGPLKGIDSEKFAETRKTYYRMMEWNESGMPTPAKLAVLEISWADCYLSG